MRRIAVEFCMLNDPDRHMFRRLKPHRSSIEAIVGQTIEWSDKQGVPRCHLIVWRENCDLFDRSRWHDYQAWQWKQLIMLRDAVNPLL